MLPEGLLLPNTLLVAQRKKHGRRVLGHLLPLGRHPLTAKGGGIGNVTRRARVRVDVAIDGGRGLEEMMGILSLRRLLRSVCLLVRRRVMRAR